MSGAWNRETGQVAFLPRQGPLDEAGDSRPRLFDRESAVYSLGSHTQVSPHHVLSGQQVPIDVHQLWRGVVVETIRNRPGRK